MPFVLKISSAVAAAAKTAKMVMELPMYRPAVDDGHRGAQGQSDDDHRQHVHHLAAHRHRGDGPRTVELSRDEQVRQTIECLEETGDQVRDRKPDDLMIKIAFRQIDLHKSLQKSLLL